ncbi:hypothetical protein LCGC14_2853420 [marine sediment metagenome]|uniref:Uncharacterized protein n=1 Tax=marine sediment metagenome TaxID=412755 RepID=A0A0F8Y7P9_9ZZZZ
MSTETKKVTNLKGRYFQRELGDGTSMNVIRMRRPDDQVFALALQLRVGTKVATCFLEDVNGVCFVDELSEALIDYLEDVSEIKIEKDEIDGEAFLLRKEQEEKDKKNKETVTK